MYRVCGNLTLYGSRLFLGHSVYLFQNGLYLKTAGHRAKRTEIWDSWILVTHIRGTVDLVGFKVNLGSFGALFQNDL